MNDDTITLSNIGDMVMDDNETLKIVTSSGLTAISGAAASSAYTTASSNTITLGGFFDIDDLLDNHSMNRFTVDHKVQEQELMKLRETVPTYADEIKENLSKNLARDIIKKATFTKKHDKDADVHHFIGRVWVFTEDELKSIINEARNA